MWSVDAESSPPPLPVLDNKNITFLLVQEDISWKKKRVGQRVLILAIFTER